MWNKRVPSDGLVSDVDRHNRRRNAASPGLRRAVGSAWSALLGAFAALVVDDLCVVDGCVVDLCAEEA